MAVNTLANALFMTHGALALALGATWGIDKGEADNLANAVNSVARHYGDIPGLNERTLDWIGLFYAVGIVYGPRVMLTMNSRRDNAPTQTPVQGAAQQQQPSPEPRTAPAPAPAPAPRAGTPTMQIADPMGSGRMITVPVPQQ